jgi:ssDNA thymidine ADP-ribosyltransferase, DarT
MPQPPAHPKIYHIVDVDRLESGADNSSRSRFAWSSRLGKANGRRWAFTLSNAGAFYAQFQADLNQLEEVNWPAVATRDFRQAVDVKEGKQAEFLVKDSFPERLSSKFQGL